MSHYDRSNQHPMGLVKQAYSAWVQLSPNARPKKWHLTAYFTYSDLQSIPTIDQDSLLKKIAVPSGIYKSGKARSRNSVGVIEDQNSISALSSTSPSPPPMPGSTRYPVYAASSRSPPTQLPHLPGGRYDEPYPNKRPTSPNRGAGQPVPMLPPIHASIDHSRNLARPTEDQRLINMLNSRHVR
jgi:Gti1/Pac2 family transcription factor